MANVTLDQVRKVYDNGYVAVHGASFEVQDGEFVVLVGPSGCGKSTTLRMIAGLEDISSGTLKIGDRVVNDVAPKDRDIAMVFQNYALYPHMNVFDNMAFGLKLRKYSSTEIRTRVQQAAEILELASVLDRKPKELSGGQRQRVALGRAIVRKPQVFLFDEPLSNLDAKLRVQMRTEIAKLHRQQIGATTIYVTHDQVEAMTMGDRIVVMKGGYIQQIAPPLDLYNHPANKFVAGFIGSPSMNFLEGVVQRGESGVQFTSEALSFSMGRANSEIVAGRLGQAVSVGIRPEDLYVANHAPNGEMAHLALTLDVLEPMGNEIFVHARTATGQTLVARVLPQPLPTPGQPITLAFDLAKLHIFDGSTEVALTRPTALAA